MNKIGVKSMVVDNFFGVDALRCLIEDAIDCGASDIHINAEDFVKFEVHGRYSCVTRHRLDAVEVTSLCNNLYKSETGSEMVVGGERLDHNFEYRYLKDGKAKNYNFRVNSVAATVLGRVSPTITVRQLDEEPPVWGDMGYGDSLWNIWRPDDGLIAVSGATGTGKSTLLASGLRRILEEKQDEKIVTLESPIEYVLHKYQKESTIVVQRSVPKNSKSFMAGVEDALRQHPSIVVIGECRKKEEILAALMVSISGHLTYITTHTNSVPETAFRLLSGFPQDEQKARLSDLIYSSRVYLNQKLLPSRDGKRVAIREMLEFDSDVSYRLERTKPEDLKAVTREMVNEYGQSFSEHANFYLKQDLITQEQFDTILKKEKNEIK